MKKMLYVFGIAAVFAIITGCGKPKEEVREEPKQEAIEEVAKKKVAPGKPGNMEEAYMEIMALTMYLIAEQGKIENPLEPSAHFEKLTEGVEKEIEKLQKEFGTEEEWEVFNKRFEENVGPAKEMKLMQRMQERIIELQEERK